MAVYRGEVGLQFTTHLAKHYSVPQWVELAAHAQRNKFSQLWINDNLGHRNIFVLLTAIASKVPIKRHGDFGAVFQKSSGYRRCFRVAVGVDGRS
jgi:hypothetical protein